MLIRTNWIAAALIGLSLSGCGFSSNLKIPVEREASFPVWLPAPGSSRQAQLPPAAESARKRGLSGASNGDWPAAIAAFKEARESAHCAPSLMFNLGLAHERRGETVSAALWYRAYLSAVPDAPNAADVRAETEKLVAETRANALRLWDEAERLADMLPATPAPKGGKSLRQAALESIAHYQYVTGMTDRADTLARKAKALPGAVKARNYWDRYGLYSAAQAWDAARTTQIIKQWGTSYGEEKVGDWTRFVYSMRGEVKEVRRILDSGPGSITDIPQGIGEARGYEIMEMLHIRRMGKALQFDGDWFAEVLVPDIESAFWDGRPDVALRLARQARAYFEKFDIGNDLVLERGSHAILLALLGDRDALDIGIRRNNFRGGIDTIGNRNGAKLVGERVALALVATLPPGDAVAVIDELTSNVIATQYDSAFPKDNWPKKVPLIYFARLVAAGQPDRALKILDDVIASAKYGGTDPNIQTTASGYKVCKESLEYALRFAVATERMDLAYKLADRLSRDSKLKLVSMNRLAMASGADEQVRARVDGYAGAACGGWRPRDAAHAWDAWRRLKFADSFDVGQVYESQSEYMEKAAIVARDTPEALPSGLANRAMLLWVGAMGAREQF